MVSKRKKEFDLASAPVDDLRALLIERLAYLHLLEAVHPAPPDEEWPGGVNGIIDWVRRGSEAEIRQKARALVGVLGKAVEGSSVVVPRRKPWREIAYDYWMLVRNGSISRATGIPYGWLHERFDCSALGIGEDMPLHAAIGIGAHAGHYGPEEDFLLRDAFFLLLKARHAMEKLNSLSKELEGRPLKGDDDLYFTSVSVNGNVAAYSRLATFSFYAFVECFVNSVGEDFIARHPDLPETAKEYLRGKKKGRYVPIERKIEKFPAIMRADGTSPLILSGGSQLVEPFASFVGHIKEIRDASTHYSRQKASIWRRPQERLRIAEDACSTCVGVAQAFWAACYPGRQQPGYLYCLDKVKHFEIAERRLRLDEASEGSGAD